jgi:hypothetical protein
MTDWAIAEGGWSIGDALYQFIRKNVHVGGRILELGSGLGTEQLAKHYDMFSVEHDSSYLERFESTYIYAPLKVHKAIKNHEGTLWYDPDALRPHLVDLEYDLLLIDGPPESRAGFVKYFDLFDPNVIMVFDDVNRRRDNAVMNSIAAKLGVPYVTYGAGTEKLFGVINDPCTR